LSTETSVSSVNVVLPEERNFVQLILKGTVVLTVRLFSDKKMNQKLNVNGNIVTNRECVTSQRFSKKKDMDRDFVCNIKGHKECWKYEKPDLKCTHFGRVVKQFHSHCSRCGRYRLVSGEWRFATV